jgi:fluoride ion exporter CrcB/FEX
MSIKAKLLGYVFLGGVLGTMLRYLLFEVISTMAEYPTYELIALSVVNLLGALFLGFTARYPYFQLETCRNLWGVGFAGSFTTMSAVTLFIDYQGFTWEVIAMLIGGVIAYGIGYRVGRKLAK